MDPSYERDYLQRKSRMKEVHKSIKGGSKLIVLIKDYMRPE